MFVLGFGSAGFNNDNANAWNENNGVNVNNNAVRPDSCLNTV